MLKETGRMPQPEKVRNQLEALQVLTEMFAGLADYSQKELVEGRLTESDDIAILDDMATDLGSKIIARLMVLWQAKNMGIKVTCNRIFYFLNRGAGNKLKGLQFADAQEKGLFPEALDVRYVVEFDDELPNLKGVMKKEEFEIISAFQKDPKQFQDVAVQKNVLAMVV